MVPFGDAGGETSASDPRGASTGWCWATPQVSLAVNKCENAAVADQQAADFWALGLEPIAVSAISGSGTGDLLDHLAANLPAPREDALEVELDRSQVAVAIVGRPNVGKSSLVNAITGRRAAVMTVTAAVAVCILGTYQAMSPNVSTTSWRHADVQAR